MFDDGFSFINEEFYAAKISARQLDLLLENGWRHFGAHFFRYSLGFYENEIRPVQPLRVCLSDFILSKSQRRILRRNQDLKIVIRPVEITAEKEFLFERHKQRFKSGTPDSIYDFLDQNAAHLPCEALEICLYDNNELLAASFFAVGKSSTSGIYAVFAPEESARSLGIFTMLLEIDFAVKAGKKFYYSGYAYVGNSFYDYKKRFSALERFDWRGRWVDFSGDD